MSIFDTMAQAFKKAFRSKARALVADTVHPEAAFIERYGSNGGGAKWPAGLSASGRSAYVNHREARRNARNAMQESCQARAIVERFADTVVDTGLRLEMTPNIEVLGITREAAEKWARDVEARFDLWAKDKKQHRSEQMNFYQSQRLYQIFQQRDNDIFTRLYYDTDSRLQNPLQFDFVDPDQVRGDALTSTEGFNGGCDDGIIRDERGRETGYKIYVKKPDNTYTEVTIPAETKGGRKLMLHGFRGEYAGQGRGYSRLAHAIQEFENITDFSAATIKKAINQSQMVAFVEPAKDEDAVNPLEDILTNQGAGPAAQMFGTSPTNPPEGATVENLYPQITHAYQVPEATMDTPGSLFLANLTKGSTLKPFPNSAPGDSFDTFVDAFAGHLAASMSIPLEVVLMKFSNNYSASRATLVLFWRVANGWAAEMDADYLSPVVEMWLSGEIAAGRVVAPGWSDPRLKAAWLSKTWIGSPMPDIDPAKSAKARRENIEIGVTNLDRESRDLNGSSAAANIEKNKTLYKGFQVAPWADNQQAPEAPAPPVKKGIIKAILDRLSDLEDRYDE